MYSSVEDFMAMIEHKNPNEPEFHQAVHEVVESLWSFLQDNQDYIYSGVMQRVVEPERVIMFRVPWRNDRGDAEVNRGYRIEFNSAFSWFSLVKLTESCWRERISFEYEYLNQNLISSKNWLLGGQIQRCPVCLERGAGRFA